MNTFSFDSIAAYQAAKGAGSNPTNEIKDILYPSSVGSSTPMSATCVSYIKGYGAVIDSTNIIVDEQYGEIGDVLIDNGGKKGWLKSRADMSATALGGIWYNSATIGQSANGTNGVKQIGFLLCNGKDESYLMSISEGSSVAYSPDTSTRIPNVSTSSSLQVNTPSGYTTTWIGSGSKYWANKVQPSGYTYTNPVPETVWDAMVAAVYSNTSSGGSGSTYSWSTTATSDGSGVATCSLTYSLRGSSVTYDNATIKGTYGYSYDKWYLRNVMITDPAYVECLTLKTGRADTKALIAWGTGKGGASTYVPAAYWCNTYNANVTNYGAGNWWMPDIDMLQNLYRYCRIFEKKGVMPGQNVYWASTQSSADYAWYVRLYNGSVLYYTKSNADSTFRVRAVSAYHFPKT